MLEPEGSFPAEDTVGDVASFTLSVAERDAVESLADQVLRELGPTPGEEAGHAERIAVLAYTLPSRVVQFLIGFRLRGAASALMVRGLPVIEQQAAPTPRAYSERIDCLQASRAAAILLLFGSVLGDPVSYLTQRKGKMVLDLFPIREHARQQLGSSSAVNLEWHNEDAFHPLRADWIMLLAIRNHELVPTTFCPIDRAAVSDEALSTLREPQYTILPDESHTENFNKKTTGLSEDGWVADAFAAIARMNEAPAPQPVLSGDLDHPNVRIDPAFMPPVENAAAAEALTSLIGAIDDVIDEIPLGPGDLLIIDNKRAVHGRSPFTPRYDGTDRWIRRINVLADIRTAAGRRFGPHRRAIA